MSYIVKPLPVVELPAVLPFRHPEVQTVGVLHHDTMGEMPLHGEGATDALPGSAAKIARMRRRFRDGCAVFHPGDAGMEPAVEEDQEFLVEDKPRVVAHKASHRNGKGLSPQRPPLRR